MIDAPGVNLLLWVPSFTLENKCYYVYLCVIGACCLYSRREWLCSKKGTCRAGVPRGTQKHMPLRVFDNGRLNGALCVLQGGILLLIQGGALLLIGPYATLWRIIRRRSAAARIEARRWKPGRHAGRAQGGASRGVSLSPFRLGCVRVCQSCFFELGAFGCFLQVKIRFFILRSS
jgi:hypothetical protein